MIVNELVFKVNIIIMPHKNPQDINIFKGFNSLIVNYLYLVFILLSLPRTFTGVFMSPTNLLFLLFCISFVGC